MTLHTGPLSGSFFFFLVGTGSCVACQKYIGFLTSHHSSGSPGVRSDSQGKEAGTENPWPWMPWPIQVGNLNGGVQRLGPPPVAVAEGIQLRKLVAWRQPAPEFALYSQVASPIPRLPTYAVRVTPHTWKSVLTCDETAQYTPAMVLATR